jgi:2-phospho-L-lactate/phosphoenolpyruvate guanylyltransferase
MRASVTSRQSEAIWGVVVARVGYGAKSRLASVLDSTERRRLALAMLSDVVSVCTSTTDILTGVIAVVDDPAAADTAEGAGALAIYDARPNDMNAAIGRGLAYASERGATTAIVLPGDIPLLSGADLQALSRAAGDADRALVIGASHDGQGTNALLLRPVDVIAPAFGPPSVDRHVSLGRAAGACMRVLSGLDLSLDMDTPEDLTAVLQRPVGRCTAAVLHELLAVAR